MTVIIKYHQFQNLCLFMTLGMYIYFYVKFSQNS